MSISRKINKKIQKFKNSREFRCLTKISIWNYLLLVITRRYTWHCEIKSRSLSLQSFQLNKKDVNRILITCLLVINHLPCLPHRRKGYNICPPCLPWNLEISPYPILPWLHFSISLWPKPRPMPPLSFIWSKQIVFFTVSGFYSTISIVSALQVTVPDKGFSCLPAFLEDTTPCSAPHRPTQAATDCPSPCLASAFFLYSTYSGPISNLWFWSFLFPFSFACNVSIPPCVLWVSLTAIFTPFKS